MIIFFWSVSIPSQVEPCGPSNGTLDDAPVSVREFNSSLAPESHFPHGKQATTHNEDEDGHSTLYKLTNWIFRGCGNIAASLSDLREALAFVLQTLFKQSGQREDLDRAILVNRGLLALHHTLHLNRSTSLNNLACVLLM
jgi:hypothetical protein